MAEPIGIASGVLALATFGFQASISLYQTLGSIESHNKDVANLQRELEVLIAVIQPLQQEIQVGSVTHESRYAVLKTPLYSCDSKSSLRDWLRMQYNGRTAKELGDRLANYKITLELALQVVALKENPATREALEQLKNIAKENERDLEEKLELVMEGLSNVQGSVRQTLENDRKLLEASIAACKAAQATADSHPVIDLRLDNNMADNSCQLIGGDKLNVNGKVSASDNRAENRASQAIGMFSTEILDRILSQSATNQQTPLIVSTVQALRMQGPVLNKAQPKALPSTDSDGPSLESFTRGTGSLEERTSRDSKTHARR
ncbi:hypothetical protein KCU92_g8661, partial [Aureobasidium melanogenum]